MASSGEESTWSQTQSSVDFNNRDEYGQSCPKVKKEQKRRPKPKDGTAMVCGVCGDKALGYNFDAVTCESCKAFFRRNALKSKTFTCSFDGNCKLDPHTRKFCSGCRLKKCVSIGMKKEWILRDDQLAKRRNRQRNLKPSSSHDGDFTNNDTESPSGSSTEVTSNTSEGHLSPTSSEHSSSQQSPPCQPSTTTIKVHQDELENQSIPLSEDIKNSISKLQETYKSIFDAPYQDLQAMRFEVEPKSANDLFNMTDIFIRRLIKFAKILPEFKRLTQEDQIFLLKGGIMEIFVLRSAMGFDKKQQMWRYKMAGGLSSKMSPTMIRNTLGNEMYTDHVKFVQSMHELTGSDQTVMMLLFLVDLFSPDRPGVENRQMVTEAQDCYIFWLKMYLQSLHSPVRSEEICRKLVLKLQEVRQLGETSSQLASQLDVSKLEPLLIEVFNLKS